MRWTVIVFEIVVAASAFRNSHDRHDVRQTASCKPGNLEQEAPSTVRAMSDFIEDLKAAIARKDKQGVAKMIEYPLSFASASQNVEVRSEEQFIAQYDKLLPENLKKFLLKQQSSCISRVGAKGFTVGSGQIWFDQFPDGKVKIFTITAVVYPGEL
jgi:hypothetical protein